MGIPGNRVSTVIVLCLTGIVRFVCRERVNRVIEFNCISFTNKDARVMYHDRRQSPFVSEDFIDVFDLPIPVVVLIDIDLCDLTRPGR